MEVLKISDKIIRKISLAFIRIHILYHAKNKAFYGAWMKEELESHGYEISFGTLYPILHNLEKDKIIKSKKEIVEGKVRKYYSLTEKGQRVLNEIKEKSKELFNEINEKEDGD